MSYEPLARRYRPQTFRDLVGQEYITLALASAIKLGRAPQAVIFTGIRGVGKTTLARIYAKALNCRKAVSDDMPCNACENCLAANQGIHEDIIEIDGASHTGVDDVRSLIETMNYTPARGDHKIYIIDEVHMLSTSAFNALLKSVEEPPAHVVFVFATTELDRVPGTIQSRCQVFHLRKIVNKALTDRLASILAKEGVPFSEEALESLARQGDGSLRDALSLLDQAISLGGGKVDLDSLKLVAPAKSKEYFATFLGSLMSKDAARVLGHMRELSASGYDYQAAADQLSEICHHAFLFLKFGAHAYDMSQLGYSEAAIGGLHELGGTINHLDLPRLFKTLRSCSSHLMGGALDHLVMENYLLEWCFDPGLPLLEDLMEKALPAGGVSLKEALSQPATGNGPPGGRRPQKEAQSRQSAPTQDPGPQQSQLPAKTLRPGPTTGGHAAVPQPASPQPMPTEHRSLSQRFIEAEKPNEPPKRNQTTPAAPSPAAASQPIHITATTGLAEPVPEKNDPPPEEAPQKLGLPEAWDGVIAALRAEKPLQARKLEEIIPIEFSPESIVLLYEPESLSGKELSNKQTHINLKAYLEEKFGFRGRLLLQSATAAEAREKLAGTAGRPTSILEEKANLRRSRRQQKTDEMQHHPLTQALTKNFPVQISKIDITDANLLDL